MIRCNNCMTVFEDDTAFREGIKDEEKELCPVCLEEGLLIDVDYCGFESVEDLIEDHKKLKQDIKKWEKKLDVLTNELNQDNLHCYIQFDGFREDLKDFLQLRIEALSHEMCAINM